MLLLTRPRDASEELAIRLDALGIGSFIHPLLDMKPIPLSMKDFDVCMNADALVVTSQYALLTALYFPPLIKKKLLCVGQETAARARAMGFTNISIAGGDTASLQRLLDDQHLVYLRGQDISQPLHALNLTSFIVYKAVAIDKVSPTLPMLLRNGMITSVSLFSRRSAQIFNECIMKAELYTALQGLPYLCFSENISSLVKTWHPEIQCFISAAQTREDFLTLAKQFYDTKEKA